MMRSNYNEFKNTESLEEIARQLAIQNQIKILELANSYSEVHKYSGFDDESLKRAIMCLGKECGLEF